MLVFITRRLLLSIPILLLESVLVFSFMNLTTDPARALVNPRMNAEQIERVERAMGLDKSGPAQYFSWLSNFVRGNWGVSFIYQQDVAPILADRMWNTVKLMLIAVVFSLIISLAVGVYSSVRPYSKLDYGFTGVSFIGISIPTFWFGLMAQLVLAFYLQKWLGLREPIFFTTGMHRPGDPTFHLVDFMRHATLPALTLSVQLIAGWGRYERSSMLEVLNSDYLRTARAKGLSEWKVVMKHALRNALIPLVTVVAIDIGALFGGLIVTEVIFSWPGMGSLFTQALFSGDFPIVLAFLMVSTALIILFNLLADISYAFLDPRIRYG